MKKYESFYMPLDRRDGLRKYCHEHNFYYELSSCYDGYWFEILCSESEAQIIEDIFCR